MRSLDALDFHLDLWSQIPDVKEPGFLLRVDNWTHLEAASACLLSPEAGLAEHQLCPGPWPPQPQLIGAFDRFPDHVRSLTAAFRWAGFTGSFKRPNEVLEWIQGSPSPMISDDLTDSDVVQQLLAASAGLVHDEALFLDEATTTFVSDEVCAVVDDMVLDLPGSDDDAGIVLSPDVVPYPVGLAYLAVPVKHKQSLVVALGWEVVEISTDDEEGNEGLVAGVLVHQYYRSTDQRLGWLGSKTLKATIPWGYGEASNPVEPIPPWLFSLWHFMSERITKVRASRPQQKRYARAGRPPEDAQVKVVHLRPIDYQGNPVERGLSTDTSIEYSHRWTVKGHWRNQWYPSIQDHSRKWIHGYVKGPVGAPLIVKERVVSVDR